MLIVSVEEPEPPVTGLGLKLAAALEGTPVTLRVTSPVNPPDELSVTVYAALEPRVTFRVVGEPEIEKSPMLVLLTTSVTVLEWIRLPLVPVMVNG